MKKILIKNCFKTKTTNFIHTNARNFVFLPLMVALLAGCAGVRSFNDAKKLANEGKIEQAVAKYEDAVKDDPANAEYRIALANYKSSTVNKYLVSAEAAFRDGKLSDAEKIYRQVQVTDPDNVIARNNLEKIVTERKHRQLITEIETQFDADSLKKLNEATSKLHSIRIENPDQKQAINLQSRIDEAKAKLTKPKTKLSDIYSKPISLTFQDAPIKAVFDVISKVSGLNFFFDKDLRPDLKVTIMVKNSSLNDAVRLLMVTNQLEQKVLNDNSILIYPNTPQKLKDYQALTVRTFYLVNADVKAVSTTLKTILKIKDMVVDERLGIIIVRDTPEAIHAAEKLVSLQDLGDPEVMLEVEVLEIKRAKLLELGIQWPNQLSLTPLQVAGAPLTLEALRNLKESTIQASIGSLTANARKEDQSGDILANPRIRVKNKEKAKILIGDRVPVITTTSTSTGFVSESVNYVDVGLKLDVEPTIYLDDDVGIKVNLEVSSIVREVLSKTGSLSYQIGTRGANTTLRLKNGETQILAGLISNEERSGANKVPLLGELPIIGRLFKSQKDDSQRSEILLSITPRIMRSIKRPDLMLAEFDSGTDTYIGMEELSLNSLPEEKAEELNPPNKQKDSLEGESTNLTNPNPIATKAELTQTTEAIPKATQVETFSNVTFNWELPAQIKVGEQFSAVLTINSPVAIRNLPVLIGFEPQFMQLVNVQEGDFFKQNNGETRFTQRSDAQGKVFASVVRQSDSAIDTGTNGIGKVLTVTFKALKSTTESGTKLQLLSANPEPALANPVKLPVEKSLQIVP